MARSPYRGWRGLPALAAGVFLLGAVAGTEVALSQDGGAKTHARQAAFYRIAAIDRRLADDSLQDTLERLATAPGEHMSVRVLNAPAACQAAPHIQEAWEARIDAVVAVELWPPSSGTRYYLSVGLDFGGLEISDSEAGNISIAWYECAQEGSYALYADVANQHFLLMDGDTALWGLSLEE